MQRIPGTNTWYTLPRTPEQERVWKVVRVVLYIVLLVSMYTSGYQNGYQEGAQDRFEQTIREEYPRALGASSSRSVE